MRFKNLVSGCTLTTCIALLSMAQAADPVVSNGASCIAGRDASGAYYGTPVYFTDYLANHHTTLSSYALCPIIGTGAELASVDVRVRDGHSSLNVQCSIYCLDQSSASSYSSAAETSDATEDTLSFSSFDQYSDGPCMVKCALPDSDVGSTSRVYSVKVTPE